MSSVMGRKSQTFGNLFKAGVNSIATCEGKTAPIVEEELGKLIGVSGASIQKYKTGYVPSDVQKTLKVLAEQIVNRGYMNQSWVEHFLHAASHPSPDGIINELFSHVVKSNNNEVIYENLPTPPYEKFIMRHEAFAELCNGLKQRSAIVLLISLGGMGKTSLAREIASESISKKKKYFNVDIPRFSAAVWISDSSQKGTTNLSEVFDTISKTLDYPDYTKLTIFEKTQRINELLSRRNILIIIDNFETIQDISLIDWMLSIPEPSKILITSREYNKVFRNNTFVIEIGGMKTDEAILLANSHAEYLGIGESFSNDNIKKLIKASGGNPKAIKLSLGFVKYENKNISDVLDDLYMARSDIFDDLFNKAWDFLTNVEKKVLISMALFAYGSDSDLLMKITKTSKYEFDISIEKLSNLSLFDVYGNDLYGKQIYKLHPLVYSFASSRFESSQYKDSFQERLIDWCLIFVENIGFAWNDVERLKLLDASWMLKTIESVIHFCRNNNMHSKVIEITNNIKYYYYVRGIWDSENNLLRAESSKKIGDDNSQFEAITYHINIASKQENKSEVEKYLPKLEEMLLNSNISKQNIINYRHAKALFYLSTERFDDAYEMWSLNLSEEDNEIHSILANRRWMAICEYKRGDLNSARNHLDILLDESSLHGFKRGVLSATMYLISIDIDEGKSFKLKDKLDASIEMAISMSDNSALAFLYMLYGKIYIKIELNKINAISWLKKSLREYEKLGNQKKMLLVRSLLVDSELI